MTKTINTDNAALAEWAMEQALKSGADQAAVSVSAQKSISIEFREKRMEQLKESSQRSLSVEIYTNQRYSAHSTNDLRKDFLAGFIRDAVTATQFLAKDEYRRLPDPEYYPPKETTVAAGEFYNEFNLCDNDYDRVETPRRIQIAADIEEAVRQQSDRIISVSAGYYDSYSESIKIHSNGFSGQGWGTVFYGGAEVTVKGENSGRPEGTFGANSRFSKTLLDAETIGKNAAERALCKIGQKKIASGKYDMIVENRAGLRLISTLQGPMGGRALQQKNSFLEGMLGKKIASEQLTLTDDPFVQKGFGTRYFDGEGLAAQKRVMVENGILRHYYIDTYYGRKLGMDPTSGSGSNTLFTCGSKSLEDMIKQVKKGILVTGFIGGNANSTTGDFSFGIVGMLIENGEIATPVNEMNISDNAKEFWSRLAETGNDPYPYSATQIPSMVFEKVNFSGN
jgi:PmbA protein